MTPLKIVHFPVHEVAMTISLALRFIPTLLDETDRIMKAQASRGVDFQEGKLSEKIRAIVSLIVPLFISAFQRSDELANAMEARGYDPSKKRTRYRLLKWKMRDTLSLVFILVLFGVTLTLSILGFVIIYIVSKILKNKFKSSDLLCELEIFFEGRCQKVKTLVDTGNLLKEPISNLDVIIVEKSHLKNIINETVMLEMKNIISGNFIGTVSDDIYRYKFKLIPFTSLGSENGVLIGFKPDYVKLYSYEEKILKKDVFIGIYDGRLSKGNNYVSLVGANIFEEGIVNEYSTIS